MELYQFSSQKVRDFAEDIDHAFAQRFSGSSNRDWGFKLFRRQIKKWTLLDGLNQEVYDELNSNLKHDNEDITWTELVEGVQDAEWALSLRCRQSHRFGSRTSPYNEGKFQVDQDGNVIVYTDGACLRNGQPGAQAGIGVWFDYDHPLNVSKPLNPTDPATNNVAEIKAVIEALKIVKFYGVEKLAIHTDSMYLINSITNWIFSWLSSDWRKRDGEPIKHKIQYRELLRMMEDVDIEWVYVRGHGNHAGNIEADHLARQGAQQY
ncbi:ribonuclease H1-like [Daphnia pulicaria]|uniref:ribonuclease H1-like n=1 Tax=Daphnia pulicaria TaxID=35523 RepID=UPI001EEC64B3|nr:ribonuclease H1-like [Daphnia pulicaria]XP_046653672.1 ribonuclease H1-like [Daphnia pulicaria]XP_046653674.1 ribonuclease H1-like [Daphnia pulicaria]